MSGHIREEKGVTLLRLVERETGFVPATTCLEGIFCSYVLWTGWPTAILGPTALAAVTDIFGTGRGERTGWYSSATMVGRLLAPLVGGILIFGDELPLGLPGGWLWRSTGTGGSHWVPASKM